MSIFQKNFQKSLDNRPEKCYSNEAVPKNGGAPLEGRCGGESKKVEKTLKKPLTKREESGRITRSHGNGAPRGNERSDAEV